MFLSSDRLRKNGTQGYSVTSIVAGVSVDLNYGEMVCLMGPSGTDQSTLFHMLAGIIEPDSGEIHYHKQGSRVSLKELIVGIIFESDNLFLDFKVKGNFKIQAMMANMPKSVYNERFDLMVKRYSLSHFLDEYPDKLSEMDKKWVALAKMELLSPDYYFLEDPTLSMSPMFKARYLDTIKGLSRSTGMFIQTSDIVCGAFADRVLYMADGVVKGELVFDPSLLIIEREAQLYSWLKGKGW